MAIETSDQVTQRQKDALLQEIEKARSEDLFTVINSAELNEVTRLLDPKSKTVLKKQIKSIPVSNSEHKKSQAVLASFTEGPSIPIYLLGVIAGSVTITLSSFLVLSASIFVVMMAAGIIHSVATYNELKEKDEEEKKSIQFMHFRLLCADELLRRLRTEVAQQGITASGTVSGNTLTATFSYSKPSESSNEKKPLFKYQGKKKKNQDKSTWLPRLRDTLGITFVLSLIMFESYYITAIAVTQALALTTAATILTGGIGLGIALGLTLLITGYLGYKHYQHNKQREKIQEEHDDLQKEITSKHKECYKLKEQLSAAPKHEIPVAPPTPSKTPKPILKFANKRNVMFYSNTANHLFKPASKLLVRRNLKMRYGGLSYSRAIRKH